MGIRAQQSLEKVTMRYGTTSSPIIQGWWDLISDAGGFDLCGISGGAGGHPMNHVAIGAGCLEALHVEGLPTIGAGDFQGHGHGLSVETHQADLVDDHSSIRAGPGASVVHVFFFLKGNVDRFHPVKMVND
jgi:hypothetical protein